MPKYSESVLTNAGIDLAKRANAGKAKFTITRTATTADDLSKMSVEQLEQLTELPNAMQYGKILDAEDVESDNAVIGVSLRFTNEGLTQGYKINAVGLYVQEEGQDHDFLYAITVAQEPEYMPDFNDKVLNRFSVQMYVVVGRAPNVNVLIDDKTVVSIGKFNKHVQEENQKIKNLQDELDKKANSADVYTKAQVDDLLKVLGKVKAAKINGGDLVSPDTNGVLNLTVPDPDLSPYAKLYDLNQLAARVTKTETTNNTQDQEISTLQASVNTLNTQTGNLQTNYTIIKEKVDGLLKTFDSDSAAQTYSNANHGVICVS